MAAEDLNLFLLALVTPRRGEGHESEENVEDGDAYCLMHEKYVSLMMIPRARVQLFSFMASDAVAPTTMPKKNVTITRRTTARACSVLVIVDP